MADKVTKLRTNSITPGAELMSRIRGLGSMLGMMFSGNRDLYSVFGYKTTLTYDDFLRKYARQDIAARIVESEPKATWADSVKIEADETFQKAWNDLLAKISLMHYFIRLDKIAGMSTYAILLIGYNDSADLELPVRPGKERKINYLQPYAAKSAVVSKFDENPASPRYGLPEIYEIRPDPNNSELATVENKRTFSLRRAMKVHHTRVIHVAENILEDSVYGYPRMQKVYNLLDDLAKISGGSAETFWLTANRGMQIDVDKEMELKGEDLEDLSDEVDEYQHGLRRVLKTRGVKVNMLGSDVADPRGTFAVLVSLISGATGIPQRILLGSEAGQLASEQDRANWAIRISERRADFAEPTILLPFILNLIHAGVLPQPKTMTIKWPEAFKMSPLERAQAAAQKARTLANVAKALSEPESSPISREEGRSIIGIEDITPIFDSTDDTST